MSKPAVAVAKPERQKRLRLIQGEYLLSLEGVTVKCDIGKTKLLELVKAGKFPQPIHLDGLVRWRGQDVDSWIQELARSCNAVPLRAVR